jgi:DNA-binding MurR/RpiR family transcriptional regulator
MSTVSYLNELAPTLSPIERRIAKFFTEHANELVNTPILQVAQSCETSKSAVVRLCKRMGYNGYKDFLTALSAELALKQRDEATYQDLYPESSIGSICAFITQNNVRALDTTMRMLDLNAMERAVQAISAAPRIDFYGVGNSGLVAQDAEIKFRRIGFNAYSAVDTHRQVISAATLHEGDVAMFFSYYGETKDILEAHALARKQGATTIAITRFGRNTLSAQANISLQVASTESLARSGAMSSRLVMLEMLDMVFTVVSSRNYDRIRDVLERTAQVVREKRN